MNNTYQFKKGDIVRTNKTCGDAKPGVNYTIGYRQGGTTPYIYIDSREVCSCTEDWILISKANSLTQTNMLEKFKQSLLKEPQKSFRKAGITNGDNMLTSDGNAIFMSYLLEKFGADFKTEVVDPLLAEEATEKKA